MVYSPDGNQLQFRVHSEWLASQPRTLTVKFDSAVYAVRLQSKPEGGRESVSYQLGEAFHQGERQRVALVGAV